MDYNPPLDGDLADPNRSYFDPNPGAGVAGSSVGAQVLEYPQREILNVIKEFGLTPNNADLTQLKTAIVGLINAAVAASSVDTGVVGMFATSTAPVGWLKANGALISRVTYAGLFTAIGTTFGVGDGTTTFALPDLRGEFLRGWDDGRGIDLARALGSWQDWSTGRPKTTTPDVITKDGTPTSTLYNATNPSELGFARAAKTGEAITSAALDATGAVNEMDITNMMDGDPETRARNIALLACIKY